jgi:hypothetical protein
MYFISDTLMFANTPTRGWLQHQTHEEEKMEKYRSLEKTIFFSCEDVESLKDSVQRKNRGLGVSSNTIGTCFWGFGDALSLVNVWGLPSYIESKKHFAASTAKNTCSYSKL